MAFTFHKSERLCNKGIIEKLFDKGNRGFTQFPFRFSWVETTNTFAPPFQILIIVSKRNFPKANQRNRIKRQIRELYRLHKHILNQPLIPSDKKIALLIAYLAKDKMLNDELMKSFRKSIIYLANEFEKTGSGTVSASDKSI